MQASEGQQRLGAVSPHKLTIYLRERARLDGRLLADHLVAECVSQRLRCAILLRGVEGYGHHGSETERLLSLSEDLPLMLVAIDSQPGRLEAVATAESTSRAGLVTLERVTIADGSNADHPGAQLRLSCYIPRHARTERGPAYLEVVRQLQAHGVDGATAFLGVDGAWAGRRVKARLIGPNREVPLMIIAVGGRESVLAAYEQLRSEPKLWLATVERVRILKRDGELLDRPTGAGDLPEGARYKLSLFCSSAARYRSRPIHEQLLTGLRELGIPGATGLRGIWGYHGDHRPHGERLLRWRRHAPLYLTTIVEPRLVGAAFALFDQVSVERGLVIEELIPIYAPQAGAALESG